MDTYKVKMTHDESELTESALRHFLNADIVSATFEATQDLIVKISDHNHSVSDWFPASTGEMVHVDGGYHAIGA